MLLMALFVSRLAYSQVVTKDGLKLVIASGTKQSVKQLDNQPLTKAELVSVYRYLVELEKVRSDYSISQKQIDYLKQINGMQSNQIELKEDMIKNLESYAEQVKPDWWQSEIAIIAWIAGAVTLTYLVVK